MRVGIFQIHKKNDNAMELEEYIKNVVFQIADGVSKVIKEQEKHNVIINPKMTIGHSAEVRFTPGKEEHYSKHERPVQMLHLEIGIEATEENKLKVNSGLDLQIVKFGGSDSNNIIQSSTNKVNIAIPVCLPISEIKNDNEQNY